MIRLCNVWKTFTEGGARRTVARGLTATLPSDRPVALLGRNGAGKSSLLRMIAGSIAPDAGSIVTTGSVSWPVGFAGSFHGEMTGAQNTRFVARLYGADTDELCAYVEDFAGLGAQFRSPVRTYSAGMRARLAFGVSMGLPFDTYLIDEVTAVGDAAFRERSEAVLVNRLATRGAIVVSHSMPLVRRLCRHGAVLEEGRLTWHDDIEAAIAQAQALMQRPASATA